MKISKESCTIYSSIYEIRPCGDDRIGKYGRLQWVFRGKAVGVHA